MAALLRQSVRRFTPQGPAHRGLVHKFPSETPKRIIFGSCSDSNEDLSYWKRIHSLQPDLVLLMGDNVYAKSSSLRKQYNDLTNHKDFQTAQKDLCILATMDDNDYPCAGDDEALSLFQQTFRPTLADPEGFYQVYEWSNELQVILLDIRTFCSPFLTKNNRHIPDNDDMSKTMLGFRQWNWLAECLHRPFERRIIVSPIQVLATGHDFECWAMLPHERQRLMNMLLDCDNALILSGDRHASATYNSHGLHEVTSSSLTHAIPPGLLQDEHDEHRVTDFVYQNNFGMLELSSPGVVRTTIHHALSGDILMKSELQ